MVLASLTIQSRVHSIWSLEKYEKENHETMSTSGNQCNLCQYPFPLWQNSRPKVTSYNLIFSLRLFQCEGPWVWFQLDRTKQGPSILDTIDVGRIELSHIKCSCPGIWPKFSLTHSQIRSQNKLSWDWEQTLYHKMF